MKKRLKKAWAIADGKEKILSWENSIGAEQMEIYTRKFEALQVLPEWIKSYGDECKIVRIVISY